MSHRAGDKSSSEGFAYPTGAKEKGKTPDGRPCWVAFIALDRLTTDPQIQLRAIENEGKTFHEEPVEHYLEIRRAGAKLARPKVTTDETGDVKGHYWVYDGFHTVEAEKRLDKFGGIECEISVGTDRTALFLACRANSTHPIHRTKKDRERAALTLVTNPDLWEMARKDFPNARNSGYELIAHACNIPSTSVKDVLKAIGYRIYEAKPVKSEPPKEPSSGDESFRKKTKTQSGVRAAGESADDQREGEEDEPAFTADTQGYSPPRPSGDKRPYHLHIADGLANALQALEWECEKDDALFTHIMRGRDAEGTPVIRETSDAMREFGTAVNAVDAPGYLSAKQREAIVALAHANKVDPIQAHKRMVVASSARALLEQLRSFVPKIDAADAGRSAA